MYNFITLHTGKNGYFLYLCMYCHVKISSSFLSERNNVSKVNKL